MVAAKRREKHMGTLSIWHILILAIVALLLFGGHGKVSDLMADVGKGIRSFRKGLSEPDEAPAIAKPKE